jgi:hypothetical protein
LHVRALSYDLVTTLEWLRRELGVVRDGATGLDGLPFARAYDGYASLAFRYPTVVDGPESRALFDDAARSAKVARFAKAR